jgi:septal ring factor EnvC (AmiA/AmiB activator)
MKEFFNQFKGAIYTVIIGVTLSGLAVAADSRWLTQTNFKEWVVQEQQVELREEIRDLRREINALETELLYTDDLRKTAAIEQQIQFLELEIEDLERQLEATN